MQVAKGVAAAVAIGGVVALFAAPAWADVTTPPGRCQGTATFTKGLQDTGPFVVDSKTLAPDTVTKIPLSDDVQWTAGLNGVDPKARPVSGHVAIDLPWPFGTVAINSWDDTTTKTENSGTQSYDLPSAVPRGVVFEVQGEHREGATVYCSGTAKVEIEGSAFSTPLAFVSLAGLAASGVGVAMAGRSRYRRIA
jgi:hypothetical protein